MHSSLITVCLDYSSCLLKAENRGNFTYGYNNTSMQEKCEQLQTKKRNKMTVASDNTYGIHDKSVKKYLM